MMKAPYYAEPCFYQERSAANDCLLFTGSVTQSLTSFVS
jgi:hypothetical protein